MLADPQLYSMGAEDVTLRQALNATGPDEVASVSAAEAPLKGARSFHTSLSSTHPYPLSIVR